MKSQYRQGLDNLIGNAVFVLTILVILGAFVGSCYGCGAWIRWVLHP